MNGKSQFDARSHNFTSAEVARLEVYRAAVKAGLYSDTCAATSQQAASSEGPAAEPSQSVWPFNPVELARLAAYRAAIQAGFYSDGRTSHRLRMPHGLGELPR